MCRSKAEGGRRCPGGHSSTREAQAARQRLCRARKVLATAEAAVAAATPQTVEAHIQQAYARATSAKPGRDAKCTLTELRKQLTNLPRKELDTALSRLLTAGQIRLEPEMLRHRLTDEDRAAAIRLGGEEHHLIMMERVPGTAHAAADLAAVAWAARQLVTEAEQAVTSLKEKRMPATPEKVEATIREAYEAIAPKDPWGRPDWCSIAEVRARLSGVDRGVVDDMLRAMALRGDAYLVPEADQKTLTDEDRKAAIVVAGTAKHRILFEPDRQ